MMNVVANKHEQKRNELIRLLKTCIDKDNHIDIGQFRSVYRKEYGLLSHYFGNISNAIQAAGGIKEVNVKNNGHKTLRNKLAYDMIQEYRKQHNTFDAIAKKYGVSREAVSKLNQKLSEG